MRPACRRRSGSSFALDARWLIFVALCVLAAPSPPARSDDEAEDGGTKAEDGYTKPEDGYTKAEDGYTKPEDGCTEADVESPRGVRRALIFCGHPGDAEHQALFRDTIGRLHRGLTRVHGFLPEHVWIREGFPGSDPTPSAEWSSRGQAGRDEVSSDLRVLGKLVRPSDTLWVFILGHAHVEGEHAFWNVPGPDIRDDALGDLFREISCAEQVFSLTTAASGYMLRHLSRRGRVVIAATEADREVNETIFHGHLSRAIESPPGGVDFDADGDGRTTILDLHVHCVRVVLLSYAREHSIPTEHAQLDDNGDGRGTEVQIDYLEPDLGGRAGSRPRSSPPPGADGSVAARIVFARSRSEAPAPAGPDAAGSRVPKTEGEPDG